MYSADGAGKYYGPGGTALAAGPSKRSRQFLSPGTLRFNAPVDFVVDANAEYGVELFVTARAEAPNTADAYLDPVIALDPAYRGAYSLVLSAGVSNLGPTATTAPEPGSLALLGAGVLGVVGIGRRRQREIASRRG